MKFYKNRSFLSSLVLLVLFLLLAYQYKNLVDFDGIVSAFIQDLRSDQLTEFFIFITYIGSFYISFPLVIVVATYCFFSKKIWAGIMVIVNLFGVRYLNGTLKDFISRERPGAEHLVEVGGLSFPSGHAMNSAAFFGFLAFLIWFYAKENNNGIWFYVVGLIALILLIGISRVYLGVHYPSDVLAGFIAGTVWLIICVKLFGLLAIRKS